MKKNILTSLLCLAGLTAFGQPLTLQTLQQTGGPQNDYAYRMVSDDQGNVYMTGIFAGMVDFDPGPGTTYLTASGNYNAFVLKLTSAGNLAWVKQIAGAGADSYGYGLTLDEQANVYLGGNFGGTVDLDPGAGTVSATTTVGGGSHGFIVKLNNSGNYIWSKTFGSSSGVQCRLNDLKYHAGHIYSTGYYIGPVDFDPGAGTAIDTASDQDAFLVDLDTSGTFTWFDPIGGIGDEAGTSIDFIGATTTLILAGTFTGNVDMDPSGVTHQLVSEGNSDIFIGRYSSQFGSWFWSAGIGGPGYDMVNQVAMTPTGEHILVGNFSDTVDFDPGAGVSQAICAGGMDGFVLKLSNVQTLDWVFTYGGSSFYDNALAVWLDGNNNIFVSGSYLGTSVDFDPGSGVSQLSEALGNSFIQKLSPSGQLQYVSVLGEGGIQTPRTIEVTGPDTILVFGSFEGTTDFQSGSGTNNLTSAGGSDMFLARYIYQPGVGLQESSPETWFIYPNPASDFIRISLPQNDQEQDYTITDISGKICMQGVLADGQTTLFIQPLAPGIYLLNYGHEVKRFVKQ